MAKSPTRWLTLLVDDAPRHAFEDARTEALAAASPADRKQIDADADRALHLRGLLTERAQRVEELSALYEIAARLTSLRDPDRLLQDIAAHARRLLGVDVAYLALSDDGPSLTIQVVSGSMGSVLEGITIARDVGIAGPVLTTGQPFWTPDYRADARIHRTEVLETAARQEQLRGILGVPLRVRDEVIGVLFAAERARRAFTDGEVALLESLAAHAATAIDNARLFAAERTAAAGLAEANEQLRHSSLAIGRAATLHERLTTIVAGGGGILQITASVAQTLGAPVGYVDTTGQPEREDDAPMADLLTAASVTTADQTLVCCADEQTGTASPIRAGEDHLGWLVTLRDLSGDEAAIRLLERGALAVALVIVRERAVKAAEEHAWRELVDDLVNPNANRNGLPRRVAAAGLDPRRPHVVATLDGDASLTHVATDLKARFGGLVTTRAGHLTAILPAPQHDEVVAWLRAHLPRGTTAGVSQSQPGLDGLPDAHAEADRCLAALRALDRDGDVASPDELGVYRFFLAPGGAREAAQFVDRVVGPLLTADRERGSELASTLDAYLASGHHHGATAQQLGIHANTLYQRLNNIAAILGDDWRSGDRALELQMALRLHRLAARLDV